ncbi:MAG TPA: helix-turn-helix domain-containing protein [Salinivirga sp.]|uniref:helix-turn-helix domain-containing protein n=1 Tax=Salinivirga sp. TaxID=1970192 RepID=UPI002B49D135|nr:helix-turn-helix domain-containing protein [Salinivirga sp.]HKK57929.1 helix-turn-helix domain-containing protein [Salinivirga sp.]
MESLKFTVIKTIEQYIDYCNILDELISKDEIKFQDEIELLTLLIEKWDSENNSFKDSDPIEILKAIMDEHELKAKDLVTILGLTKGTVSKVLNYQKGLSKDTIRKLSDYFKVSQEAFNRPYRLKNEVNRRYRNASLMNTRKNITEVS